MKSYNNRDFQSYCGIGNSVAILCMMLFWRKWPWIMRHGYFLSFNISLDHGSWLVFVFQQIKSPFLYNVNYLAFGWYLSQENNLVHNCSNKFIKPSSSHTQPLPIQTPPLVLSRFFTPHNKKIISSLPRMRESLRLITG